MTVGERAGFFDEIEKSLVSGELTDFGAAVRSLRSCTGMSQKKFASMVKLPLERLRDIESNQSDLEILTLNKILLMFGFQAGITRFNRSTHPDPAGYLKVGLMANHREKYP